MGSISELRLRVLEWGVYDYIMDHFGPGVIRRNRRLLKYEVECQEKRPIDMTRMVVDVEWGIAL